jgi:ATP-dependent helicase YprA (DUF1998 family)
VVSALKRRNIEALFPIQGQVLRPAMEGRDLTGRAKTGSGKTLAFALPVVESLLAEDKNLKGRKAPGRPPRCVCGRGLGCFLEHLGVLAWPGALAVCSEAGCGCRPCDSRPMR